MSYSNGLLVYLSTKIIEGIPGVGFKLTTDGNYDMKNKKLTNLKPGTDDSDALTKKQTYDHIKVNGGSSSKPVDLTDYLKKDGSVPLTSDLSIGNNKLINLKEGTDNNDAVTYHQLSNTAALKADKTELTNYVKTDGSSVIKGHLLMDNNRLQNIAPPRQNSNAVNYAYLNNYYLKYDDENSELDCQSQINMQNKRIVNVKFPRLNHHDAMGYAFFTNNFFKVGYNNDIDCNGKRFYNLGSYTNNNQLITGYITEGRYLRKNLATINMNAKRVTNAKTPISNNDLATKAYVDTRSGNVNLSNYLKKSGDTMSGPLYMSNNKIIKCKKCIG